MEPARNYTWPPFEVGNVAAVKHGGDSERRWRPIAERLVAELPETAPWAATPSSVATVHAWARTEAQILLVASWLDEVGVLDDEGAPRPATGYLSRLEARAQTLRGELGLSPMSLARLLGVVAEVVRTNPERAGVLDAALAEMMAEGRRIIEAREAREAAASSQETPGELGSTATSTEAGDGL